MDYYYFICSEKMYNKIKRGGPYDVTIISNRVFAQSNQTSINTLIRHANQIKILTETGGLGDRQRQKHT